MLGFTPVGHHYIGWTLNCTNKPQLTCGTFHNITGLSSVTAAFSFGLFFIGVPINALFIITILCDRKKFNNRFFKLVLNINFADLLTGLVPTTASIVLHLKEVYGIRHSCFELYVVHLGVFYTDAVALTTISLLCFDGIVAIIMPIRYFQGITNKMENIFIYLTWPFCVTFLIPYFKISYIRELIVFSCVHMLSAAVFLLLTTFIYRRRSEIKKAPTKGSLAVSFKKNCVATYRKRSSSVGPAHKKLSFVTNHKDCITVGHASLDENFGAIGKVSFDISSDSRPSENDSVNNVSENEHYRTKKKQKTKTENRIICRRRSKSLPEINRRMSKKTEIHSVDRKARRSCTRLSLSSILHGDAISPELNNKTLELNRRLAWSFRYMVLGSAIAYMPAFIVVLLLNSLQDRYCFTIHILRDISLLSILSGCVIRPFIFLRTMKTLKKVLLARFVCFQSIYKV